MPQTRYVLFSIDTLFDVFDPWVEAILCLRPGMSYLVLTHSLMCLTHGWDYTVPQTRYVLFSIDTLLDGFDPLVEAILCSRPGMSYLVLTHS